MGSCLKNAKNLTRSTCHVIKCKILMHILFNEALWKVQRTNTGHLQDKYETFMGQIWDIYRNSISPITL